jgi:hypothetical protein
MLAASFSVEDRPCLVGGSLREPLLLPVEEVEGRKAVAICAFAPWIHQVMHGRTRGDCDTAVGRFLAAVYAALESGGGASCPGSGEERELQGDGASCLESRGRGRAAMGLDDDSDVEAILAVGGPVKPPPRGKLPQGWTTVAVAGVDLTVRARPRGRGLLLPLRGPELPAALALIKDSFGPKCRTAEPLKRKRADREALALTDLDKGRVIWLPSPRCWQVLYTNDKGVLRRTQRHLAVPTLCARGKPLTGGELEEMRLLLLQAARRKWNELDKSEGQRFPAHLCEAQDSA